jgi:hypothetical protein
MEEFYKIIYLILLNLLLNLILEYLMMEYYQYLFIYILLFYIQINNKKNLHSMRISSLDTIFYKKNKREYNDVIHEFIEVKTSSHAIPRLHVDDVSIFVDLQLS